MAPRVTVELEDDLEGARLSRRCGSASVALSTRLT